MVFLLMVEFEWLGGAQRFVPEERVGDAGRGPQLVPCPGVALRDATQEGTQLKQIAFVSVTARHKHILQ